MKVLVLGLDGATWDILDPLISEGAPAQPGPVAQTGAAGTSRFGLSTSQPGGLDRAS